jgi:hypothetical protein
MEAALEQVEANQGKVVKLKKVEQDLLKAFEEARDYMLEMLSKESRETLQSIFGGDCKRIAEIANCLDNAAFSDKGNQEDQRVPQCRSACESVEKVLEDLGLGWALRQAQEKEKALRKRKSQHNLDGYVAQEAMQAQIGEVEPVLWSPWLSSPS